MLNQTSFKQVDQVRHEFFLKYPNAESLSLADELEVSRIIRPLGFYNRRARTLVRFSKEWLTWDGNDVSDLHGIGRYASDSWKIFQQNDTSIQVEDKKLLMYLSWAVTVCR